MTKLLHTFPEIVKHIDAPVENGVPVWAAKQLVPRLIPPDILLTVTDYRLFYIRHARKDMDIYFFTNQNRDKSLQFNAGFSTGNKVPYRLDPETGERQRFPVTKRPDHLDIELAPLESLLLVFAPDEQALTEEFVPIHNSEKEYGLPGPWQTDLKHVDGRTFSKNLPVLRDLSAFPEFKDFAGSAVYTTAFTAPVSGNVVLDLGNVHEIADISLDGQSIGTKWWGERKAVLPALGKGRTYTLQLKITGLLFNYCLSLKDNPVAQYWVKRTGFSTPMPAGLIGPVKLVEIE